MVHWRRHGKLSDGVKGCFIAWVGESPWEMCGVATWKCFWVAKMGGMRGRFILLGLCCFFMFSVLIVCAQTQNFLYISFNISPAYKLFFFYFKPLGWLLSIIMWRNRMDYSWGFMRCAWWACCPFRLVIDFKAATTIAPELFPRNTEHFFGGWDKKSRNLLPLSAIDWYLLRLVTL